MDDAKIFGSSMMRPLHIRGRCAELDVLRMCMFVCLGFYAVYTAGRDEQTHRQLAL